jgi:MFS family permease
MAFRFDLSAIRATLGNRNFAVYTAGNGVSLMGSWVQRVAVGWLTWELTHSGTWLGAVSLAEFLPVIVMAPIAGVMADRYDRRTIAIVGQILAMIQALALMVLTFSGNITPMLILLLQVASGIIQPVIQTARLVLVPTMLPKENVANAVAITSLTFNFARVGGPAIAGLIITGPGVAFTFAINALSYVGVIAALVALKLPSQSRHPGGPGEWRSMWSDLADGWRYTFAHPVLGWVILLISFTSTLTWPISELLPGIADEVFGRGAAGLAAMVAAQGFGALFGGLFLAGRKTTKGLSRIYLYALMGNGIVIALFSMTSVFALGLLLLSVNAAFGVTAGVGSQTLAQTAVDDHMRARSLSVWYTVTRIFPAVGALGLGTIANYTGFQPPLFAAGALTVAAASFMLWRLRQRALPPPV